MLHLEWQAPGSIREIGQRPVRYRCGLYQCMVEGCYCPMFEGESLGEPCENCGHMDYDHFND